MNLELKKVLYNLLVTIMILEVHSGSVPTTHHRHRHDRFLNKFNFSTSKSSLSFLTNSGHFKEKLHRLRQYHLTKISELDRLNSTSAAMANTTSTRKRVTADMFNVTSLSGKKQSYKDFYKKYRGKKSDIETLKRKLNYEHLNRARTSHKSTEAFQNVRKANEHLLMVRKEGKCDKPKAKVINIQDVYHDVRKLYVPRCTILYRCDSQVGCCDNDKYECAAKKWEHVRLYFYTLTTRIDPVTKKTVRHNKIENLLFQNHTECQCQDMYDIPRVASVPIAAPTTTMETLTPSHYLSEHSFKILNPIRTGFADPPKYGDPETTATTTTTTSAPTTSTTPFVHITVPTSNVRCADCPLPFNKRPYVRGGCSCDCFDKQRDCIRIKRGRVPLAETERRCVEAKYCHEPECEFGNYMTTHGRCPKRSERKHQKRKHSFKYNKNRWTAHERD